MNADWARAQIAEHIDLPVEEPFEPRWYHFAALTIIPLANPYVLGPVLLRLGENVITWLLGLYFVNAAFGG